MDSKDEQEGKKKKNEKYLSRRLGYSDILMEVFRQ